MLSQDIGRAAQPAPSIWETTYGQTPSIPHARGHEEAGRRVGAPSERASSRRLPPRITEASHDSGGVEENAEYEEAKNELALIEARISEIERCPRAGGGGRQEHGGEGRHRVRLVGRTFGTARSASDSTRSSARPRLRPLDGKISIESPVGKALVGHRVGDVVEVETPSGVNKLTVTRVR